MQYVSLNFIRFLISNLGIYHFLEILQLLHMFWVSRIFLLLKIDKKIDTRTINQKKINLFIYFIRFYLITKPLIYFHIKWTWFDVGCCVTIFQSHPTASKREKIKFEIYSKHLEVSPQNAVRGFGPSKLHNFKTHVIQNLNQIWSIMD